MGPPPMMMRAYAGISIVYKITAYLAYIRRMPILCATIFSAMQKTRFILSACLLLAVSGLRAQVNLDTVLPVDPAVRIGHLSNGLTYYIRKNALPEKKVELRLVVNAGSILENDAQRGLAHFCEHMAFNGTKHFQKNDLVSFLQSIGVQFGADLNAYTAFDQTVYILPIPLDKPDNLEK